ncbi:MAG: histidine phosphatase family protein [Pseudomonadales bacterium]|nr:histidine phosphatase family protein [Pseudomonadales bacterium]MCP5184512.1 histidine phosphatase family protein [Pseudomonadales bacterium]
MSGQRLWLIRHAKSDWAQGAKDIDRPLNERGRRDGPFMAEWLHGQPHAATWLWTSTALRARETAAYVARAWELDDKVVVQEPQLYLASPTAALEVIRGTPADATSVAVVFHNPGITDLVNLLAGRQVLDNLPTFGIAEFSTSLPWAEVHYSSFELERVVSPKALRLLDGGR